MIHRFAAQLGSVVAALTLVGCDARIPGAELVVETLIVGNVRISVEIAATDKERMRGLMYREELPENHGMLFLFPKERVRAFWMKNTLIPLSIAYADSSGRIVHIADLEPHSESSVSSRFPSRYALEMNRGWFEKNGVFPGDVLRKIPRVSVE